MKYKLIITYENKRSFERIFDNFDMAFKWFNFYRNNELTNKVNEFKLKQINIDKVKQCDCTVKDYTEKCNSCLS